VQTVSVSEYDGRLASGSEMLLSQVFDLAVGCQVNVVIPITEVGKEVEATIFVERRIRTGATSHNLNLTDCRTRIA
jgi:hypothetical protein